MANASEPSGQAGVTNVIDGLDETELIEDVNESYHVVLYDVVVSSELIDDDKVNVTLTNTSDFVITDWSVAYEASYDIISVENAELVLNNQVKEFKALNENKTLEAGKSITVNLEIVGTYDNNTEYRVYGLCDEISEDFAVVDCISYNVTTGTTSLETFDYGNMQDVVSTQGLDVITTDIDLSDDAIEPLTVFPDEDCTCAESLGCVCYCTCENWWECTCVTTCGCDGRTQVSNVNVAPYNKIALLITTWSSGVKSQATGFLINSKHMLTNAHCVYNPERGTVTSITAYFGANGYTYSASISASEWSYCSSYPSDDSASNDWAHIELSSSPGRGYFSLNSSVTPTTTLTLCGYPSDRMVWNSDATILNRLCYMYKMSGVAEGVYSKCLYYYKIDTNRGQSGSPIYNSSNQVVGIDSKSGKIHNSGCRITQSMINAFYINGWCA